MKTRGAALAAAIVALGVGTVGTAPAAARSTGATGNDVPGHHKAGMATGLRVR